ncbi:MAG: hypothetical protein ACYDC4_11780 [Candidatus Dormibacteria bacterium]
MVSASITGQTPFTVDIGSAVTVTMDVSVTNTNGNQTICESTAPQISVAAS